MRARGAPQLGYFIDSPGALSDAAPVLSRPFAALAAVAVLVPTVAAAQAEPKFAFAKAEEIKAVEWKVQAKAGGLLTAGNSQARSAVAGLSASRKEGGNKLTLDAGVAYGTTNVLVPIFDAAMPTMITGNERRAVTTTNNWLVKGRYDRFFTTNNSAYASGQGAADTVAGKEFFGGGQAGYSRQLVKDDLNLVVAEIGYDFSHERYVQQPMRTLDPITVHSARVFLGETLKLSEVTGLTGSVEALFNLNKEGKALNAKTGLPGVDPLNDTRIVVRAGLTTTVWKALSVALGFTLRYDQNPAPLPIPSGSPAGSAYAAGVQPFAQRVDTLTEATLIYTFL